MSSGVKFKRVVAALPRVFALRWTRAGLLASTIVGLLLCLSPLLGAPGIESALVLGLVLPPFACAMGVRIVDARRSDDGELTGEQIVGDVSVGALAMLAIPFVLILLNTIRNPVCGLGGGIAFIALGPGIAVMLAAGLGALIGRFVSHTGLATTLAFFAPVMFALVEVYGFYSTPAIFAYGHLVGYFPGSLYDADISVTATYLSFRGLSLVWLLALFATLSLVFGESRWRLRWRLLATTLALVLFGGAGWWYGAELGHRSSADSITEALGGRVESERCIVVFPRELAREDAQRLADDCDFRVRRVEQVLGVRQPRPITAFFFRSREEKRALMGASNTYIAKPWRDEVYLQQSEWPHPVLFHEIVHVVAGNIGVGPFRVAATGLDLIPSPAIIEGTAVAVAWEPRDGLTPHQWARAMLEVDLAPEMASVQGLSFLLQPASRAYTASGSFLRWIMDTRGREVVRRLYIEGDWEEALGQPVEEAEAEWHTFLREEVELPEEARALAQRRFERPGIFGRICPHRIANLYSELSADLAAGNDASARSTCAEILALDPGQVATRAALVGAHARLGSNEEASRELAVLVGPPAAAPPVVQRAEQDFADALWRRGVRDDARARYERLLAEPMETNAARQLEVRLLAIEMGGEGELALRALLVPRRDRADDSLVSMHQIARLRRVRDDGLAAYLEARQLLFRQRFHLALPPIREARRRGLPTERVSREARRMDAIVRFGVADLAESETLWREILRDGASSAAEALEATDWLARIRFARRTPRRTPRRTR